MNTKNGQKKTDLRIIRTKINIHQAFFDLLCEKPYDKITVAEISERAMINRNTFYLHYRDKEELLETLCREHLDRLHELLSLLPDSYMASLLIRQTITSVLKEIDQNRTFYRIMLNDADTHFTESFKEEITSQMMKASSPESAGRYRIPVEYIASGFIGAVRLFLTQESPLPLPEMDALIWKLITENILEILLPQQHK